VAEKQAEKSRLNAQAAGKNAAQIAVPALLSNDGSLAAPKAGPAAENRRRPGNT
jgi:hypothetical protein